MKDKNKKGNARTSRNNQPVASGENQPQGWKNYLTSFWK
jgi:hypothetical protein